MAKLSETLKERGYVQQFSSKNLEEITDGPKRTVYLGIDPSADSLQVGQLQAFLILRHFIENGHKVILLVGGGTGMIGDPGGKSAERPLLSPDEVRANTEKIAGQAKTLFGRADFVLLDNAAWLSKLKLIEFLRDVGKHFTVNAMLQRDFIKERVKNPDEGISYTEFSYALLQAYDFFHLHRKHKCDVQVGGSDQWGNIVSGIDFIRRKTGDTAHAFTWPLLVDKSTGKKFGKSEVGTIWLDSKKTSPYQFYQFWYNTDDKNLKDYLLKMTMLSRTEIDAALVLHKREPRKRHVQQLLAREVTTLVHGEDEAIKSEKVSQALFGEGGIQTLSAEEGAMLKKAAPSYMMRQEAPIVEVLIGAGLASSKREARQFLSGKAVVFNGKIITDPDRVLERKDFHNGLALLVRGKKHARVVVLE